MKLFERIPLYAVWTLCAFNITFTGNLILRMALHPEGRVENPLLGLALYSLPHLIIAAVAWVSRRTPTLVWILLGVILVITLPGSFVCLRATEESLRYADYRAKGKQLMNCGPPVLAIAVALQQLAVWGVSLLSLLAAIVLKGVETRLRNRPQEMQYSRTDNSHDDKSGFPFNSANYTFRANRPSVGGRETDFTRRE